jgi:hypothetical protein
VLGLDLGGNVTLEKKIEVWDTHCRASQLNGLGLRLMGIDCG